MLPVSDFKSKKINKLPVGKIRLKVIIFFAILTMLLFGSQLVFANNLVSDGQKLSKAEQQIQQLEAENTSLQAEIAKISSFTLLKEKAAQMGFKSSKSASL